MYSSSAYFGQLFFHGKLKKGFILGYFLANSSGHPGSHPGSSHHSAWKNIFLPFPGTNVQATALCKKQKNTSSLIFSGERKQRKGIVESRPRKVRGRFTEHETKAK
jgi:hypothetical protein